jgi:predicted amidophosphoribosyltransferase
MQEALDHLALTHPVIDALIPVPPRPGKLKKTGWDQIEYLAKKLEKKTTIPVLRCLSRSVSRSQKELNREQRSVNLRGKIQCSTRVDPTVAIFDDVITTGATLNACAEVLRASGAQRIYGIVLFYD